MLYVIVSLIRKSSSKILGSLNANGILNEISAITLFVSLARGKHECPGQALEA